ncbi:MAG: DUF6174 domain-containing protein [Gemmatimonadaceae bacterium]
MRKTALIFCALALASGCGDDDVTSPGLNELNKAVALWSAVGGVNYTMDQQVACFCAFIDTYHVAVEGNSITNVVKDGSTTTVPVSQRPPFLTVNQLFNRIRTLIATKGAIVTVTYDAGSGYPKSAYLDPSPNVADDEVTYSTANISLPLK